MKKICTPQLWPVMLKLIRNFRIVSRAALKGSEGREFDTPGVDRTYSKNFVGLAAPIKGIFSIFQQLVNSQSYFSSDDRVD